MKIASELNAENFGIYCDKGLIGWNNFNGRKMNSIRKKIVKIQKTHNLKMLT